MTITTSIHTLFDTGHIKAILLDHAGVLTRIEDAHGEARRNVFNGFGCNITTADGKSLMGFGEKNLFSHMQAGLADPPALGAHIRLLDSFRRVVEGCNNDPDIFQKLHQNAYQKVRSQVQDPLSLVRPGLPEMLLAAHMRHIPIGVISNSDRTDVFEDIGLVVQRLNELCLSQGMHQLSQDETFKVILTADDMRERKIPPKDSPAPYLHGIIDMMSVVPAISKISTKEVYVVEDAKKGFDSADRAGTLVTHVYYEGVDNLAVYQRQPRAFAWVSDLGRLDEITLNPDHPVAAAFIEASMFRKNYDSGQIAQTSGHPKAVLAP